jgi:hypothetical protein
MTIANFEMVLYTAIFILPGFLTKTIVNSLYPPKRASDAIQFLSYLGYSLVTLAICSWAVMLINPLSENIQTVPLYWFLLLVIILVGTVLTSLLVGFLKYHKTIQKLAKKLRLHAIDPIPTAWDYKFHDMPASFVVVTLRDGAQIHGWFGRNSRASSDEQERDLFLEKVYTRHEDGAIKTTNENQGILISKDVIKYIEFINMEEKINDYQ